MLNVDVCSNMKFLLYDEIDSPQDVTSNISSGYFLQLVNLCRAHACIGSWLKTVMPCNITTAAATTPGLTLNWISGLSSLLPTPHHVGEKNLLHKAVLTNYYCVCTCVMDMMKSIITTFCAVLYWSHTAHLFWCLCLFLVAVCVCVKTIQ